jgi:hypothetical protein
MNQKKESNNMKQVKPEAFYVYEFNELNDAAKQVAYDTIKDIIIDDRFSFFEDDCYEVVKDVFNLLSVKSFSYSITSSQGDGVSFTCDDFNSATITEAVLGDQSTPEDVKDYIKAVGDNLVVKTVVNQRLYSYAASNQVSVHLHDWSDNIFHDMPISEAVKDAYAKQYIKVCKHLEDMGYKFYEVTLEEVEDFAMSNGYEFYEDGRQY